MENNKDEEVIEVVSANNNVNMGPRNDMALAGFICSISGFITCGIVSIVGLFLSISGLKKANELNGDRKGLAIAGIVMGAVETVMLMVSLFLFILFFGTFKDTIESDIKEGVNEEWNEMIEEKAYDVSFRDADDNLLMTSNVIDKAEVSTDSDGNPAIKLIIKNRSLLYEITSDLSKKDDNTMVIWYDFNRDIDSYERESYFCGKSYSNCLSAASVTQGSSSDIIIKGNYTRSEVEDIVKYINNNQ